MKSYAPAKNRKTPVSASAILLLATLLLVAACAGNAGQPKVEGIAAESGQDGHPRVEEISVQSVQAAQPRVEEIAFQSGSFHLVGDLRLPEGTGPFPVVLFVHGSGEANRVAFGMYVPLMERMLRAGYATFAWDKPGIGESTGQLREPHLRHQRAQIVLDAIEVMKARRDIDPQRIGLWGISQAGYVMPLVLSQSKDIAFMICVSCAGASGSDQTAFNLTARGLCDGVPEEKADEKMRLVAELDRVRTFETYEEYLRYREVIDAMADLGSVSIGDWPALSEQAWQENDSDREDLWNPTEVIEQVRIPVLAIFGEKDSQGDPIQGAYAWRKALEQAGNPDSRVEVFPDSDHLLNVTETGCLWETGQTIEQVVSDQGYTSPDEFLQDPEQIPLSALPLRRATWI